MGINAMGKDVVATGSPRPYNKTAMGELLDPSSPVRLGLPASLTIAQDSAPRAAREVPRARRPAESDRRGGLPVGLHVIHDQSGSRFYLRLKGYEACLMYRRSGHELDLCHTYVPEEFRGRGVAEQLCRAAFEYAKSNGLTVIPRCAYISGTYLKRHPEYRPLTRSGPDATPLVSG